MHLSFRFIYTFIYMYTHVYVCTHTHIYFISYSMSGSMYVFCEMMNKSVKYIWGNSLHFQLIDL